MWCNQLLRTGNQVTKEPLHIVEADPLQEREEVVEVVADIARRGSDTGNPLADCWLMFDVDIGAVDGEDRLATRETFMAKFVAVFELDAEHLGQAVADLCAGGRHAR